MAYHYQCDEVQTYFNVIKCKGGMNSVGNKTEQAILIDRQKTNCSTMNKQNNANKKHKGKEEVVQRKITGCQDGGPDPSAICWVITFVAKVPPQTCVKA